MNLGISGDFGDIEFERLRFPAVMSIDYIRVYQPKNAVNIGCDPVGFPTNAYIETYVIHPLFQRFFCLPVGLQIQRSVYKSELYDLGRIWATMAEE